MPKARRTNGRLVSLLLLALTSGCQGFHSYRPVTVLVRDAETQEPIRAAEVRLSYPFTPSPYAPAESSGKTGDAGVARLQAAPFGPTGAQVDVSAPGYLTEHAHLSDEVLQAIEPEHLFEKAEQRPPNLVVEMLAGPGPSVELVLPNGYRGLVNVDVQVQDGTSGLRGQRCFRYDVTPAGTVQVIGPPLLRRVYSPDYTAHYAEGKPLSREVKDEEIGFWCLKTEANHHTFFVGTSKEHDDISRFYQPEAPEERQSSSNSNKGGRGGRGRRGNPSGDSGSSD